jgi:hypothetical protein
MYTIIDMYAILQAKRYEFLMYNIELNISSDEYEDYFQEFQEVVFSEIYDQEDTRKYKALKREDLNFQRFI